MSTDNKERIKRLVHGDGSAIGWMFFCPGCAEHHAVWTDEKNGVTGALWGFNGSRERPTFTPSIKVTGGPPEKRTICHSFVKEGRIQYLADSTHSLASQTVDLPLMD